ncbi:MAG: hypothetical protein HKN33_08075 [Pyrinomonadaceae bacterium]|nr:hypothetical protein [Pyrinomonadaceae bacterium]
MKKSLLFFIASIVVMFGLTVVASAQTKTPGITKRQKNQQKRIFKGVKNGSVTGREFKKLQKQQFRTQKAKKRAKSDGVVTKRERVRLHKRQNKNSRTIWRAKHNKRNRRTP